MSATASGVSPAAPRTSARWRRRRRDGRSLRDRGGPPASLKTIGARARRSSSPSAPTDAGRRSARRPPAAPGVPAATTSRASTSASMVGTPRLRKRREHVALARRDAAGQRDADHGASRFGRGHRVLQQQRDRERTDTAGHRRQGAGDLGDRRVHVADDERAASLEVGAARRVRRETATRPSARSVTRLMPTSTTVAPGLTQLGPHERRRARRPQPGCRPGASDRRQVRRPRVTDRHRGAAGAAAASPSACRRCRCGR